MEASLLPAVQNARARIERLLEVNSGASFLPLMEEAWVITISFMMLYQRQRYLAPRDLDHYLHTLTREKLDLADVIGMRITQLGGKPDYKAQGTGIPPSAGLESWLHDALAAERLCSELWTAAAARIGGRDALSGGVFQTAADVCNRHALSIKGFIQAFQGS